MQFGCDSCKTQLQIADEKVRGKRLIVRCKRCGAKIAISDPALAKAAPRMVAPPSPGAAVAAQMRAAPAPAPVAPAPSKPAPAPAEPQRNTDTESTRAMDSDLLEKALQASKADDASAMPAAPVQNGAAAPQASAPPPVEQDPGAVWFAMLHGKQAGPFTHVELQDKTNQGEVGPRTYLWKEGMGAWQRAKDLTELAALFPQLPEQIVPPPPVMPPPPSLATPFSTPEFVAKAEPAPASKPPASDNPPPAADSTFKSDEQTAVDPDAQQKAKDLFSGEHAASKSAENLATWARDELEKKSKPPTGKITPVPPAAGTPAQPMFAGTAPPRQSRAPFFLILGVAAAAIIALWAYFGSEKKEDPPRPPEQAQTQPAPAPQKPAETPAAPQPKPEEQTAPPAENKPQPPPAQPIGLTADQVRKKLDENKGALQGCIDEALRRDPNLRVGKIHIATTIAPSGAVTSAKIDKSTVDQSPLGSCLKRATRRIAFPGFSGDAFDVDIPIVVTAGE